MYDMDISQLEELIVSKTIGSNPVIQTDSLDIQCRKFVDWCFKSSDIKKNLMMRSQFEWDSSKVSWLEHYKGTLIQHLRDMKLNTLLK